MERELTSDLKVTSEGTGATVFDMLEVGGGCNKGLQQKICQFPQEWKPISIKNICSLVPKESSSWYAEGEGLLHLHMVPPLYA